MRLYVEIQNIRKSAPGTCVVRISEVLILFKYVKLEERLKNTCHSNQQHQHYLGLQRPRENVSSTLNEKLDHACNAPCPCDGMKTVFITTKPALD